jgi:serine/threonine-protein kinase RsbW
MAAVYELGSSPHSVQLEIPARPEYIRLGRLALTGLARVRPLSAEVLGDLKLALTEAWSVRRQSAGSDRTLEIRYELHDEYVVIELSDRDSGFVVDEESASRGGELSEPTMALGIIRALADELELGKRGDGSGSRLRFVKRLDT